MFSAFRRRERLVLALRREWLSKRNEVLQSSVVVDFDGDAFESFVAAVRTKSLTLVERQLEATVASFEGGRKMKIIIKTDWAENVCWKFCTTF